VPIFAHSSTGDSDLLAARRAVNSFIVNIERSSGIDVRAPLVEAGAYFVLECWKNESKGSSPLSHFASISNCSSEESVHFGVVEGIFRWMVVSGFIESRDIIQIAQEAVVEAYYSPDSGALDDACLQNLITCVGVPFIGSAARIWFGESHGNQYVTFQNAHELAALQPTLSCFFSKFSRSHGDHGASCNGELNEKNGGIPTTSKVGAFAWYISLSPHEVGSALAAKNVTVSIVSRKLQLKGISSAVNAALSSLSYRGSENWNSLDYGADVVKVRAEDAEGASATEEVFVFVAAVNDPPVVMLALENGYLKTREDTRVTVRGISIADNDLHGRRSQSIKVQLASTFGTVSCTPTPGVVIDDGKVLRGPLERINDALSTMQYTPSQNWNSNLYSEKREVQSVSLRAAPPAEVFVISTSAKSGFISGNFTLLIDLTSFADGEAKNVSVASDLTADDLEHLISNAIESNATVVCMRGPQSLLNEFTWRLASRNCRKLSTEIAVVAVNLHAQC
jgi:hypothetical protein